MAQAAAAPSEEVSIDGRGDGTPFPHYWEQMFGSGRAILSLRDGYRRDIRTVKQATGFTYIRFHGIFLDEAGLFDVDGAGKPVYNFSYIDQIYDGLLENGVKPYVELSFMPKKQAPDPPTLHFFWYHEIISPPKDYAMWDAMIDAFTRHLVERYGIDEVSQWYFEVWNEPNIDFWDGNPKLETYLELYDHTAHAVKKVDARLRVGGPSTARAAWTPEFLAYCKQHHVPVDFLSTHVYGTDRPQDVFLNDTPVPQDRFVCQAVRKVHDQIKASAYPEIPLIISEFNADWDTHTNVTDSSYMGAWLATTISQCDGMTKMMSYWSFSDVFEEQGVVKKPFYGGYGLMAEDNIPKPALNAFAMLHQLGDVRLPSAADSTLVTRRKDGAVVVAVWNYAAPSDAAAKGPARSFTLKFAHAGSHATVRRLDAQHGDVNAAYAAMGQPDFPSRKQIAELQEAGRPAKPESMTLNHGKLTLTVPAQGLVVIEVK